MGWRHGLRWSDERVYFCRCFIGGCRRCLRSVSGGSVVATSPAPIREVSLGSSVVLLTAETPVVASATGTTRRGLRRLSRESAACLPGVVRVQT